MRLICTSISIAFCRACISRRTAQGAAVYLRSAAMAWAAKSWSKSTTASWRARRDFRSAHGVFSSLTHAPCACILALVGVSGRMVSTYATSASYRSKKCSTATANITMAAAAARHATAQCSMRMACSCRAEAAVIVFRKINGCKRSRTSGCTSWETQHCRRHAKSCHPWQQWACLCHRDLCLNA